MSRRLSKIRHIVNENGSARMFFLEILIVLVAYFIGSLSAALIVSKKLGMPDPRSYGSGNPGASNMLRSGRKDAATMTLIGDALKGLVAVLIARCLASWLDLGAGIVACSAIAVVAGHMYPIFFGFKGGKGVATALGVLLGMSFWATFWVVLIWGFVAFKFKKSSLAALVAAAFAPMITFIVLREHHVTSWGWAITAIAILVFIRHRSNICRMCKGEELLIATEVKSENSTTQTDDASNHTAANDASSNVLEETVIVSAEQEPKETAVADEQNHTSNTITEEKTNATAESTPK